MVKYYRMAHLPLMERTSRYKQVSADGRTHEFPFHVTDFNGKQMVFKTFGNEGSRVTAVKSN